MFFIFLIFSLFLELFYVDFSFPFRFITTIKCCVFHYYYSRCYCCCCYRAWCSHGCTQRLLLLGSSSVNLPASKKALCTMNIDDITWLFMLVIYVWPSSASNEGAVVCLAMLLCATLLLLVLLESDLINKIYKCRWVKKRSIDGVQYWREQWFRWQAAVSWLFNNMWWKQADCAVYNEAGGDVLRLDALCFYRRLIEVIHGARIRFHGDDFSHAVKFHRLIVYTHTYLGPRASEILTFESGLIVSNAAEVLNLRAVWSSTRCLQQFKWIDQESFQRCATGSTFILYDFKPKQLVGS